MKELTGNLGLLKRMSWGMTIVLAALLTVGVMFIYSACYISEEVPTRSLWLKQSMWIAAGAIAYAGFAMYDYRQLRKMGPWIYIVSLGLLVSVLLVGKTIYGAKRWLPLVPPLGIGIQPSEVAKLAAIIMLAGTLSRFGVNTKRVSLVALVLAIVAVPMALVVTEPDVGTAMIFLPAAFVMMFVAGARIRDFLIFLLVAVAALAALAVLSPYRMKRITGFLDPWSDPYNSGFQLTQ